MIRPAVRPQTFCLKWGFGMADEFCRTQLLLGGAALGRLSGCAVAVFGIGGVGSSAAEALARSGVGRLALFDHDSVCPTNINRQIIAAHSTIGRKKVQVMRERILDINPACSVTANDCFYGAHNADDIDLTGYDYIVDAIDTVSCKLELIERARRGGVPIISCMGAGNKLDPTRFETADIYDTQICPLARAMRRGLRARGVESLKVVYSREQPVRPQSGSPDACPPNTERQIPGSAAFVVPAAGLLLAREVILDLIAPPQTLAEAEDQI
jgi:tRNA A37 threonylcarbamoyladenosine dehydratase